MSVELYAIREKASGSFLLNKHYNFGSFEEAVENGVYFNQRASAEKRIKEIMRMITGAGGNRCVRYKIFDTYFSADKEYAIILSEENKRYGRAAVEFRLMELEVVPLLLGIK